MEVRRVMTGHDHRGHSVFISDERLPIPDVPGIGGIFKAWGADEPQKYPSDGANPDAPGYFPPVGGVRCLISTLAPGYGTAPAEKIEAPELAAAMEDEASGLHITDTTDFVIILSGSAVLGLDDGTEVRLDPGDLVVQNGTRHRWRNDGTEPITMMAVLIGAHRG